MQSFIKLETEGIHFHLCTAANSKFILIVGGVYVRSLDVF